MPGAVLGTVPAHTVPGPVVSEWLAAVAPLQLSADCITASLRSILLYCTVTCTIATEYQSPTLRTAFLPHERPQLAAGTFLACLARVYVHGKKSMLNRPWEFLQDLRVVNVSVPQICMHSSHPLPLEGLTALTAIDVDFGHSERPRVNLPTNLCLLRRLTLSDSYSFSLPVPSSDAHLGPVFGQFSGMCNLTFLALRARWCSPDTIARTISCLLYTSPSPRDRQKSRMPSSA